MGDGVAVGVGVANDACVLLYIMGMSFLFT